MIHKIVQTIQETVEIGHPSLCTWLNQTARGAARGDIFARHLAAHERIWN